MGRLTRAIIGSGVAISSGILAFSSPGVAQAGENAYECTKAAGSYSSCAGRADFRAHGEHFLLSDSARDGAGVYLQIEVNGIVLDPARTNKNGAGTTSDFDYSWSEGASVKFIVCLTDDGVIQSATCKSGSGVA